MKFFNSIQLTLLFCVFPYGIQWVYNSNFYGSSVLFWILVLGYIASFFGIVYAVYSSFDD